LCCESGRLFHACGSDSEGTVTDRSWSDACRAWPDEVDSLSVIAAVMVSVVSLQCFDAVGWAAGRASGL